MLLLLLFAALGIGLWVADAALDSFLFSQGPFLDMLVLSLSPHQWYSRLLVLGALLILGAVIAWTLEKHRRTEAALRESERKFQIVAETIEDVFWISTPGIGHMVYISPGYERLWGRSCDSLYAAPMSFVETVHPDDRDRLQHIAQTEHARMQSYDLEYRILRPDGTVRWIRERGFPVPGEPGAEPLMTGVCTDITERKQAEQALRESEQRFRRLCEAAEEGVCIHDGGFLLDANVRFFEMFGYKPPDLLGKDVLGICIAPERVDETRQRVRQQDPGPFETTGLRKTGERFPLEARARPVTYGGRPVRVALLRDITERKHDEAIRLHYERRLRRLAAETLQAEQRERRRLAADLHDGVGQALATAKMRLQMLEQETAGSDLAEPLALARHLVEEAVDHTRSLVFDLSPPVLQELGLEPALESLAERAADLYDLDVRFEDDGRPKPLTDEARDILYRAARELLHNAARHAHAARVTVGARRGDSTIQVWVKDDGVGFDPNTVPNADEPGGGFGLFELRERMDHLGGKADIRSEPDCGTRVTLTAPLHSERAGDAEGG